MTIRPTSGCSCGSPPNCATSAQTAAAARRAAEHHDVPRVVGRARRRPDAISRTGGSRHQSSLSSRQPPSTRSTTIGRATRRRVGDLDRPRRAAPARRRARGRRGDAPRTIALAGAHLGPRRRQRSSIPTPGSITSSRRAAPGAERDRRAADALGVERGDDSRSRGAAHDRRDRAPTAGASSRRRRADRRPGAR